MKKSSINVPKLQKEDVKQAVIVDYKAIGCKSPEEGRNRKPFIQYSLEWLLIEKFDEIFICCLPDNANQLRELITNFIKIEKVPPSITIQVHSSKENHSTGDCIRNLDSKALIKTDFVIMDVGCCGNLPLSDMLDAHKKMKKVDKYAILTSIVRNIFTKDPEIIGEFPVYAIEPKTGCLLYYAAGRVSVDNPNEVDSKNVIKLPTKMFLDNESVKIYNNLSSTNLSIYSVNVTALFAEFFDCRTEASLIQAALDHQETLGYSVYIHVVDDLFSQHMADMGFVINQRRDQFDSCLIYKRSDRYDTLRQLVNKSLIGCTRLNAREYLENLIDNEEEEDESSDSESEESFVEDTESFLSQVLDSLERGYIEKINYENLILEINSSKHAYNISIDDVHSTIIKALMLLPQRFSDKPKTTKDYSVIIGETIHAFEQLLCHYFKTNQSKDTVLITLENLYLSKQIELLTDRVLAVTIYDLYDMILDEKNVFDWHSQTFEDEDDAIERIALRKKPVVLNLIESLAEDEIDSEETDSDE